jgi:hypothetical protein
LHFYEAEVSFFEKKIYVTSSKDEFVNISPSELNRSHRQIGIISYPSWLGKILSIINPNNVKVIQSSTGKIRYLNKKDYNHWLRKVETLGSLDQITFENIQEIKQRTLAKVRAIYPDENMISTDLIISMKDHKLEDRSIEKQDKAEYREYQADSLLLKVLDQHVTEQARKRGILFVEREDVVNEVLDLLDELEKTEHDQDKIKKLDSFVRGRSIFSDWHLDPPCDIPSRILLAGGPRAMKIIRELNEAGKNNYTYQSFKAQIDGMIRLFLQSKTNFTPGSLFNWIATNLDLEKEGKIHLEYSEQLSSTEDHS